MALLVVLASQPLWAAQVRKKTILAGTAYATEIIEIDSGVTGPTVWISGGVHGSELAGWKAAERIAKWTVSRGRLIVVPHANKAAVRQQRRAAQGGADLNRQFPQRAGQKPQGALATALWQELQRYKPDWVFDLHEALGNRNLSKDSVGQTIIAYPRTAMINMANQAVQQVNRGLSSTRRFQVIRNPVHGSLAHAAGHVLGANAAIVETSRTFKLEDRINWHLQIMRTVLERLNMQPKTSALLGPAAPPHHPVAQGGAIA